MAPRLFYVREITQEGKICIHYYRTELKIADIGPRLLSKHRHQYLMGLINKVKT